MKIGDIIEATITTILFRAEERKENGATYGTYDSHYVAKLKGYTDGIVVVDSIAQKAHPDWQKKTQERAKILSNELMETSVRVKVIEVIRDGIFEAELI